MGSRWATDIAVAAQLACLLEAGAPKPGNVSPGRHFADVRYEDFLVSAAAIGRPLSDAGTRSVGQTVRLAIGATTRWTRSNTNLGIVLLFAPLARAAGILSPSPGSGAGIVSPTDLRAALDQVLDATSVDDARDVYAAIRLVEPGGLGRAEAQDVRDEPDVTLIEAMRLAADRDGIAREYSTRFEVTFETGVPLIGKARGEGLSWNEAIVETFLTLLAGTPDTHIARRSGKAAAVEVSERARSVLEAGGVRSIEGKSEIDAMDFALRDSGDGGNSNRLNPGTTADLTAAAIFVVLLGGGWSSPS